MIMITKEQLNKLDNEVNELLENESEESLKTYLMKKRNKKEWKKPQLQDLDKNKTAGGDHGGFYEDTQYIPGPGGIS